MGNGSKLGSLIRQRFLVQIMFKDGLDTAITGSPDGQGSPAVGFQPLIAVAFGQPQHPQAASKALLRYRTGDKDSLNELSRLQS